MRKVLVAAIFSSVFALGMSACVVDEDIEPVEPNPSTEYLTVDATDVAGLADGQNLTIMIDDLHLYEIDYSEPMDLNRIDLDPQGVTLQAKVEEMAEMYGSYYEEFEDETFSITGDPANFGFLTADDIEELHSNGVVIKEPKSISECPLVCEYYPDGSYCCHRRCP